MADPGIDTHTHSLPQTGRSSGGRCATLRLALHRRHRGAFSPNKNCIDHLLLLSLVAPCSAARRPAVAHALSLPSLHHHLLHVFRPLPLPVLYHCFCAATHHHRHHQHQHLPSPPPPASSSSSSSEPPTDHSFTLPYENQRRKMTGICRTPEEPTAQDTEHVHGKQGEGGNHWTVTVATQTPPSQQRHRGARGQ